jgi:dTDP-4-dehydrorhamnose 3,5-epimerase
MQIIQTKLPGVLVIKPKVFGDERGFFLETYQQRRYAEIGIQLPFVQDNSSRSQLGVLRGLHYQLKHPQGKLVTVTRGAVFDVAVDIRPDSPTFKQWISVELSADNHQQLYIPPGYAHGFYTSVDNTDFHYKCTDYYHPEDEYGVAWNDPEIGIDWPLQHTPIVSQKDQKYLFLKDINNKDLPCAY